MLLPLSLLCCCLLLPAVSLAASDTPAPRLADIPGNIVSDYRVYARETFRREKVPAALGLVAATGLLIHYDQELIAGAQKQGRRLGLANVDNTRPYIKAWGLPILRGPSDTGSALYFLGDGWLHFSICGGFYAYGYLADSSRAVRTGYALLEGLGTTALLTQFLKRTTGRESPFVATAEAGRWRFFPDQGDYNTHVSHYNAFPSGHLATAMMTVTVISTSYPEYPAIAPVGYGLMSLLAFQMMNNGVHWASDYPLALSIGYSLGKISANRAHGRFAKSAKPAGDGTKFLLLPDFGGGRTGILAAASF